MNIVQFIYQMVSLLHESFILSGQISDVLLGLSKMFQDLMQLSFAFLFLPSQVKQLLARRNWSARSTQSWYQLFFFIIESVDLFQEENYSQIPSRNFNLASKLELNDLTV